MIHSLRQRHRIIIFVLAVLVPAIFLAGLLVRKPMPTNQQLPLPTKGAPR
jgi:hypothetical protein